MQSYSIIIKYDIFFNFRFTENTIFLTIAENQENDIYAERFYENVVFHALSFVYHFQTLNLNPIEYLRLTNCYGKASKKRMPWHSET